MKSFDSLLHQFAIELPANFEKIKKRYRHFKIHYIITRPKTEVLSFISVIRLQVYLRNIVSENNKNLEIMKNRSIYKQSLVYMDETKCNALIKGPDQCIL